MNVALREPWTVERFLAWEDEQEGRHEFDGTRVLEMTGGSRNHQRVIANLLWSLEDALDPERFDAAQEMRIDLGGRVRYPDLAVVAGRIPGTTRTLHDALVLFEVLSDDTAAVDREQKPAEYAALPSLRRYMLIEQSRAAVTVLERTVEGWAATDVLDELLLPELGITLPLDAVYRGVGHG